MSKAIQTLEQAFARAMAVLAEVLRSAGVISNTWYLPSAQFTYITTHGPVINQGQPLKRGMVDVPKFNKEELIRVIRVDQAGESTFPEFLEGTWKAGVVMYHVDFKARKVSYHGIAANDEVYVEEYPAVEVPNSNVQ